MTSLLNNPLLSNLGNRPNGLQHSNNQLSNQLALLQQLQGQASAPTQSTQNSQLAAALAQLASGGVTGAGLNGASLLGSGLTGSNLNSNNLSGANLNGNNLTGASLSSLFAAQHNSSSEKPAENVNVEHDPELDEDVSPVE